MNKIPNLKDSETVKPHVFTEMVFFGLPGKNSCWWCFFWAHSLQKICGCSDRFNPSFPYFENSGVGRKTSFLMALGLPVVPSNSNKFPWHAYWCRGFFLRKTTWVFKVFKWFLDFQGAANIVMKIRNWHWINELRCVFPVKKHRHGFFLRVICWQGHWIVH